MPGPWTQIDLQLASSARFNSALHLAHLREREETNRRSELDFPLFLLLLRPVKVLPPAQKFYPEIPLSTPLRNRIRLPATPSTLAVGANLRFDLSFILCRFCFALAQVVELMIPASLELAVLPHHSLSIVVGPVYISLI